MRCKQGDLAVIVRSTIGNEGHIVECVRFHGTHTFASGNTFHDCWEITPERRRQFIARDSDLRPIRDSDGQDEVLRMVGLPAGTPVDA